MRYVSVFLLFAFLAACEGTVNVQDFEFASDEANKNRGSDATGEAQDVTPGLTPTDAAALDGEALYLKHCGVCHGPTATGGIVFGTSIQAYEPIESIVIDGRGDMAPVAITLEETAKIQAWLLTLAAPAEDLDGAGLYGRYCASCHGDDATGTPTWSTSIQGYEPIEAIVMNGRGDMDPIVLNAAQINDIQNYLLSLAPALSTLTGPEVYDRLCVGCHGDQGVGTETKGLQLRYDDEGFSTYWVRNGRGTTAFDSPMPAYPEDMISDTQLEEMFTWINGQQHPTDGEGLFVQYCSNCHGLDGRGGPVGEGITGGDSFSGVIRNGKNINDGPGRRRSYMTRWNTNQLTDEEIQLITAYAATL